MLFELGRILVFGAVVAMAGATALAQAQPRTPTTAELARRLDALAAEIAELRGQAVMVPALSEGLDALDERMTALEATLQALGGNDMPGELVDEVDRLGTRLEVLERDVAAARGAIADVANVHAVGGAGGAATAPAASGGVTWDKGFGWRSDDERYALRLGGYMDARYEADFDAGELDAAGFRLRRARVKLSGHVGSTKLRYKAELDLLASPTALHYVIEYAARPEIAIAGGRDKVKLSRSFIMTESDVVFLEKPIAFDTLRYDRDIGVTVSGVLPRGVGYAVQVINGASSNVNDNLEPAVLARVDVPLVGAPMPPSVGDLAALPELRVQVGGGAVHDLVAVPATVGDLAVDTDVDGDGDVDNVRVISASADATARWRGLELHAEWLYRFEDWGTILAGNPDLADVVGDAARRHHHAVSVEATYTLVPQRLVAAARVAQGDLPFLGVRPGATGVRPAPSVTEVEAAVQLYHHGYRALGLSFGWATYEDASDAQRLIVETQLVF